MAQATPPGARTPYTQGQPTPDQSQLGANSLYPLQNGGDSARFAMQSALLHMGINPYDTGNLFAQKMMQAASGLSNALTINQGLKPGASVGDTLTPGADAQAFLSKALSSGNVFGTLQDAASKLPSAVDAIRAMAAGNGGNVQGVNSPLQALADLMNQQGSAGQPGAGYGNMLLTLLGPMMSKNMLGAYGQQIGQATDTAARNYFQNGNGAGDDIFSWLTGNKGRAAIDPSMIEQADQAAAAANAGAASGAGEAAGGPPGGAPPGAPAGPLPGAPGGGGVPPAAVPGQAEAESGLPPMGNMDQGEGSQLGPGSGGPSTQDVLGQILQMAFAGGPLGQAWGLGPQAVQNAPGMLGSLLNAPWPGGR